MNFLAKLSIARKLLLIPTVGILAFFVYVFLNYQTASTNVELLTQAKKVQFPALLASRNALVAMENVKSSLSAAVTTGDEEALAIAAKKAKETEQNLNAIKGMNQSLSSEIDPILNAFNSYYDVAYDISESMIQGTADFSKLASKTQSMNSAFDKATKDLQAFSDNQLSQFESAIKDANEAANRLSSIGIIMGIIVAAFLIAVTLPIVHNLRSSITNVVNSLKDIAQEDGDLTVRINTNNQDEIGDLVYWFNKFVEKLQRVVRDIGNASQPLSTLAQNLNEVSGTTQQTIFAQQQSASSAKSAVDNMTSSVTAVAQSANDAAEAAAEASTAADDGQQVVNQTVNSIQALAARVDETAVVIKKLEEDSNKVGAILDVIKGIAEQTNLLALNAAIEAARAGEQGRGFAVVADEVRTLASRTQQSTEEIQSTIEQLQNAARSAVAAMTKGTEQAVLSVDEANKAGASLHVITDTIGCITLMNDQIAKSTGEQTQVAMSIVQNVDDINSRTRDTASSSEKLTTVSQELEELSADFNRIMQQFRY